MRNGKIIALFLAPLLGCYAQLEAPDIAVSHTLCSAGDCVPGAGQSLTIIQVSGLNTFVVDFGNQPLLKPSNSLGPTTLNTSLILNQAAFDMKTAGGDFKGVTSVRLLRAPREANPAVPGDDPCATPGSCPTLALYQQSVDGVSDQRLVLKGNGSDLVSFIDQTTHQLIIEIQASGTAPAPALWNADVSMDMALKSRANFP